MHDDEVDLSVGSQWAFPGLSEPVVESGMRAPPIWAELLLFAITLAVQYMFFLACIFVELFLNKECTYLNDF